MEIFNNLFSFFRTNLLSLLLMYLIPGLWLSQTCSLPLSLHKTLMRFNKAKFKVVLGLRQSWIWVQSGRKTHWKQPCRELLDSCGWTSTICLQPGRSTLYCSASKEGWPAGRWRLLSLFTVHLSIHIWSILSKPGTPTKGRMQSCWSKSIGGSQR